MKISKMIPDNGSIKMLAFGLAMAHFVYGDTKACILFIVQPGEKNVRTYCLILKYFVSLEWSVLTFLQLRLLVPCVVTIKRITSTGNQHSRCG